MGSTTVRPGIHRGVPADELGPPGLGTLRTPPLPGQPAVCSGWWVAGSLREDRQYVGDGPLLTRAVLNGQLVAEL